MCNGGIFQASEGDSVVLERGGRVAGGEYSKLWTKCGKFLVDVEFMEMVCCRSKYATKQIALCLSCGE